LMTWKNMGRRKTGAHTFWHDIRWVWMTISIKEI
jgi:hypothetical protein